MLAAAAGFQNCDATPARNFATKIQVRLGNSGIEMNSRPRMTSPTTIVTRRSKRSASAPAIGPSSSAGSSVTTQTPLIDEVFARLLPCVTDGASASSARIDSQSPKLDSDSAIHSAAKRLDRQHSVPGAHTPGPAAGGRLSRAGTAGRGVVHGARLSIRGGVPGRHCLIRSYFP